MMWLCIFFQLIFSWMMIENINSLSSPITPYTNYTYSIELLANTSDLWWTVDNVTKEIIFELHVATTGWIALGISPGNIFLLITSDFCMIFVGVFSWWYAWC